MSMSISAHVYTIIMPSIIAFAQLKGKKGKDMRLQSRYPQQVQRNLHYFFLVLKLTLSQSNLPVENFLQLQPFTQYQLCSTWYPLLLEGQRRRGFKACPRLLHMTDAAGIESQTFSARVQRLNHSAMRSTELFQ